VQPLAVLVLALALAQAPALAGCMSCQPHLDVRHCAPESERCRPAEGDRVLAWDPGRASSFPDVARLLDGLGEGHHGHAEWTEEQEAGFWDSWGVPPEEPEKQLFLRHEGGLYRVRVLSC
jgi:hypothetical protein